MIDSKILSDLGRWSVFIGYTLLLGVLFTLSSEKIPEGMGEANDKLLHFLDFFLLTLLGFRAFAYSRIASLRVHAGLKATGFSISYSTLLEWNQRFIPGREVSLWDLGANFFGSLTAFLLIGISRKSQSC